MTNKVTVEPKKERVREMSTLVANKANDMKTWINKYWKDAREGDSKKRRGLIILAVLVVIIWFGGNRYYSPSAQMDRAIAALSNPKKNAGKYVTTTTSGVKINNKTVKGLQNRYYEDSSSLADVKANSLKNLESPTVTGNEPSANNYWTFVKSGRSWLLWPKYKLNVPVNNVEVLTDIKDLEIKQNDQNVGKANEVINTNDGNLYKLVLRNQLPGKHEYVGQADLNGHNLELKEDVDGSKVKFFGLPKSSDVENLLTSVLSHQDSAEYDDLFVNGINNSSYKEMMSKNNADKQGNDYNPNSLGEVKVRSIVPVTSKEFKVVYDVTLSNYDDKSRKIVEKEAIIEKSPENNQNKTFKYPWIIKQLMGNKVLREDSL
ncbi:hypothetical protein FC21_GL000305 [Limosilactobacillus equigenerosi DSM 18793 = JCM 14505]|uniref:Uncharacterized protein n=1 Tax=Limosilactobacillus equigenerosi DSM 18793 = JCM 14505 TaxID=1423742 RepID=A0A0R1UT13_9LACO|nr:hypothetical protein FC21_GL000305 [Limosilactobacillus equigenerosi DSM 18793 = JCM 14505]